MKRRRLYRTFALIALVTVLITACQLPALPWAVEPTPTVPPYTPPPPDNVAPVVIQRSPERGEALSPQGEVQLVFDRAMDRSSVETAFAISPQVEGDLAWVDERTVTFRPKEELARDKEYQVTVGPEAKAADGNAIDGAYRFRFQTVGYLAVSQVVPAPDTEEIETDSTITVVFNRPVVPLTAASDPAAEDLPDPLEFDQPVEGSGEWINTSIYTFTPDEPLVGGTTYTGRIAAGLTDATGGVLAEDYYWTFTTQRPEVTWVSPNEGADLVDIETVIEVEFNMPVDPASAESAFDLRLGPDRVPGATSVQSDTLVFTPTNALAFNRTYTVRVEAGVRSVGGGQGMADPYEWTFTTVPLPEIIGTEPADGEQSAPPNTNFRILFNTPIDPSTVMDNIEMTPPISPAQVYTYYNTWDHSFGIGFGAEPSTDYEVRIGPDIADPYGNVTGQEMTVRFRTAPYDPFVRLMVPDLVGVYDANQPARVLVQHLNVDQVSVRLYRLEDDEFFSAQDRWWEYEPPRAPIREWSVPVEAPLNEKGNVLVDLVEDGSALEPGVYVLTARSPGVEEDRWRQRRLLVVTRYNLTLKRSTDEVWAWATDLATGEPAQGIELASRDREGSIIGRGSTNADGLVRLPVESNSSTLYVTSGDPFILMGTDWNWSYGIGPWDFGVEMAYGGREANAHVYTDRPLYRPGQTVYFRGLLREEDDVRYSLPDVGEVEVNVYDYNGESVYEDTLSVDGFGAFDGEFVLPEGASLGQYRINIKAGDDGFGTTFQVSAYRPPEFEVTVTPEQDEVAAEEQIDAEVSVAYFFGGPVRDADVEWRALSSPYQFDPAQFGRYTFGEHDDPWICRWCWWIPQPEPEVVVTGSGTTDQNGELSIQLPTDVMTGGRRLTIEASVQGRDGQTISGRDEIVVHEGTFYVGLAAQQYVGEVDEEMGVDVVTVDWDGVRLPSQTLDVNVYRREWVNTYVEDEVGGRWEWQTEDIPVYTGTLMTDARAEGEIAFTPEEGGSYHVVVGGSDPAGRRVQTSIWVWASGSDYVSWRRQNNDRITLISDKSTYVPGETAEILIPSPFAGEQWAWVTVERGGILQQEVVQLESNSTVYRLPITADHAPNVFVSVVIVKGPDEAEPAATHRVGVIPLTVEPVEQTLSIALTPSVEQAEPGDTVTFDVEARDANGAPVEGAFSLDLVDKAVLSLKPRTPDAIVDSFYGRRGLGVTTSSGMTILVNRWLERQIEDLQEDLAGGGRLGMGGGAPAEDAEQAPQATPMPAEEGKDEARPGLPEGTDLREEFLDTAFWEADVVTDEDGRASVQVELPDNLTTWVLRAVGATVDTEVGEETTELLVTKPLLVRPATPRFFVVDDRAQLAALVSNRTGSSQDVEVALHADGLDVEGERTQTVTIPDGGEAEVTWWVTAEDVEAADVMMSAAAGEYTDAARPRLTTGPDGTLRVRRYSVSEVVGTGGQLTEEDVRVEAIAMPPRYDDREGALRVRLDPSLAAGMTEGLTYLEEFPYESADHIVSRFLPNVLTYQALQELGISDPELEEKLPELVRSAIEKLIDLQNDDGGWGWWDRLDSNPYLSAYTIFALARAQEAGFDVPSAVVEEGVDYLESELVNARELDTYREANRQAFILYAMAEAGGGDRTSGHISDLYRRRERLSHYGRAFLALTLGMIDEQDGRIDTLLSDIQNDVILSATGAHWEEANYDWWAMNTDTRSTAVILDAYARLDPGNDIIPNIVRWLMVARKDGVWETTQETAWALIAFTDWMVETGELQGAYEYGVWLNDESLAEGEITPETVRESIELQIEVAELLPEASNRLAIGRGAGEGRLYYTAHLDVYLPVEDVEPLNRGIIVQRQYIDPGCTEGLECPEVNEVSVGDVVQVRLTIIAPNDLYYVMVEDPLPAGAEGIDPTLATTSLVEQRPGVQPKLGEEEDFHPYWWPWWEWYSRTEMRDDRVVLFADRLPAGTYEYTYTFRATRPGEYNVIPTTANELYFPEVYGRADGRLFTIVE